MGLTIPTVKQELRELREQKTEVERKIRALEEFLGVHKGSPNGGSIVVRGGVDITPTVEAIFAENGNQPIKRKVLVDMVAKRHPEIDRHVVDRKMINVLRKRLTQDGYGKYRMTLG